MTGQGNTKQTTIQYRKIMRPSYRSDATLRNATQPPHSIRFQPCLPHIHGERIINRIYKSAGNVICVRASSTFIIIMGVWCLIMWHQGAANPTCNVALAENHPTDHPPQPTIIAIINGDAQSFGRRLLRQTAALMATNCSSSNGQINWVANEPGTIYYFMADQSTREQLLDGRKNYLPPDK